MIARTKSGTIVVPWGFTNNCIRALATSLTLAKDPSLIRVVHVANANANHAPGVLCERLVAETSRQLALRFRQKLQEEKLPQELSFYVVYGAVATEIVSFAERYEAGLIVVTKKDNFEISRLFFGSQALRVIRLAHCPVLVLKNGDHGPRRTFPNIERVTAATYR